MARNTYQTYLMYQATGNTFEKLIDIKEYPDLGGTPELLDTTTLSDPVQTNELGVQSLSDLTFTANYTLEDYKRLKALAGKKGIYAVWFGGTRASGVEIPDGSEGKFQFEGALSVFPTGGSVNEITELTITFAASTSIELVEA